MTTHFFFDLEGTVIDNFWEKNFALKNSMALREQIQLQQPATLNIFSFALHNEKDLLGFENQLRKPLEGFFGAPFVLIHTLGQIQSMLCKALNDCFSMPEIKEMGKWPVFEAIVLNTLCFHNGEARCVLFDDQVKNQSSSKGSVIAESVDVWALAETHSNRELL